MTENELAQMVSDYLSAINSFGCIYFLVGSIFGFGFYALFDLLLEAIASFRIKRIERKLDKKNKENTDE